MFKIGDIVTIKGDNQEHRVSSVRLWDSGYIDISVCGTFEYVPAERATLVQPTSIPQRYQVGDRVYYTSSDSQISGEYLVFEVETYYVIDRLEQDDPPRIPRYTRVNKETEHAVHAVSESNLERQTDYSLF